MTIYYRNEAFKFNEDDSKNAIETCVKYLTSLKDICEEKDARTYYIILLMVMHNLTENLLDEIGLDGIEALFIRRMRLEKDFKAENLYQEESTTEDVLTEQ